MNLPTHIASPNPNYYIDWSPVILDFETTNKEKGSARNPENRVILACWKCNEAVKTLTSHGWEGLFSDLSRGFLVAHNAKFELAWLKVMGYPIEELLVFDTMIAEKVLLGNRQSALDLDSVAMEYGAHTKNILIKGMMKAGVCPSRMPREELEAYCIEDVLNTEIVFLGQLQRLRELELLPILYTRCLLTPVLADIEFNGMYLDSKRVSDEYNKTEQEYSACLAELYEILGERNPNSPKQLAEFMYDVLGIEELKDRRGQPVRTAKGARKTDKPTLARLSPNTKEQKRFLKLITQQSILGTKLNNYLVKMVGACKEDGGILYANLHQTRTATHRLSSSGEKYKIQFQNFDRTLKPVFAARHKGWKVGEGDQAQLEFRIGAYLTQDKQAIEDIINHVDVHSVTRDFLEAHGQKQTRTDSKPMTFRPVFSGTGGTKAEQAYCKFFNEKYHEMYKAQYGWALEVLKNKYLKTPWGMRFYWPDVYMRHNGKINVQSEIFNYSIQSLATAEIVPISVVYLWHKIKAMKLQMFLVNTIHDSVIVELPPEEENIFRELVNQTFVSDVISYLKKIYKLEFNVPLEAEVKIGQHWGEE